MVRAVLIGFTSVLLCAAPFGRADDKKDEKKADPDIKKLQGKWEITYHETAGVEDTKDNKWTMEVKGNRYTLTDPDGEKTTGTVTLDSSKNPKHLHYTIDGDDGASEFIGIYELSDTEYKTCDVDKGKDRPTKFKTDDPTGQVSVWKRVKVKD